MLFHWDCQKVLKHSTYPTLLDMDKNYLTTAAQLTLPVVKNIENLCILFLVLYSWVVGYRNCGCRNGSRAHCITAQKIKEKTAQHFSNKENTEWFDIGLQYIYVKLSGRPINSARLETRTMCGYSYTLKGGFFVVCAKSGVCICLKMHWEGVLVW